MTLRYEKPKPFPLLMKDALRDKLTRKALKLGVNRGWMVRLMVEFALKNLPDSDILEKAENNTEALPGKRSIQK